MIETIFIICPLHVTYWLFPFTFSQPCPRDPNQFINQLSAIELLTDGLIFIGSTSHVILTSQYQSKKSTIFADSLPCLQSLHNRIIDHQYIMNIFNLTKVRPSFTLLHRGSSELCINFAFVYCVMISTNQLEYFKRSAFFWRWWKLFCCYIGHVVLLRSRGQNVKVFKTPSVA